MGPWSSKQDLASKILGMAISEGRLPTGPASQGMSRNMVLVESCFWWTLRWVEAMGL